MSVASVCMSVASVCMSVASVCMSVAGVCMSVAGVCMSVAGVCMSVAGSSHVGGMGGDGGLGGSGGGDGGLGGGKQGNALDGASQMYANLQQRVEGAARLCLIGCSRSLAIIIRGDFGWPGRCACAVPPLQKAYGRHTAGLSGVSALRPVYTERTGTFRAGLTHRQFKGQASCSSTSTIRGVMEAVGSNQVAVYI
jgi:hypothetical protein